MSRREARRSALFALYKWDLTGQLELEPDADEYTRATSTAVQRDAPELDARITASAEAGRPTGSASSSGTSCASRSTSSRRRDVPPEVAIDEAVTLAKRYASEDAGRLVNGSCRVAREEAA